MSARPSKASLDRLAEAGQVFAVNMTVTSSPVSTSAQATARTASQTQPRAATAASSRSVAGTSRAGTHSRRSASSRPVRGSPQRPGGVPTKRRSTSSPRWPCSSLSALEGSISGRSATRREPGRVRNMRCCIVAHQRHDRAPVAGAGEFVAIRRALGFTGARSTFSLDEARAQVRTVLAEEGQARCLAESEGRSTARTPRASPPATTSSPKQATTRPTATARAVEPNTTLRNFRAQGAEGEMTKVSIVGTT